MIKETAFYFITHKNLHSVNEVKSFKDEAIERGGDGITLVILK